jgi:hypothetical protein
VVYLKWNEAKREASVTRWKCELVAGMIAGDYYGPNYLMDMALATRYADAQLLGGSIFQI